MQNLPLEEEGAKAEAEAKRKERIVALNIVGSIYYVTSNNTKEGTQTFPSTFRVVAYTSRSERFYVNVRGGSTTS
jgi:hypothetical protein